MRGHKRRGWILQYVCQNNCGVQTVDNQKHFIFLCKICSEYREVQLLSFFGPVSEQGKPPDVEEVGGVVLPGYAQVRPPRRLCGTAPPQPPHLDPRIAKGTRLLRSPPFPFLFPSKLTRPFI